MGTFNSLINWNLKNTQQLMVGALFEIDNNLNLIKQKADLNFVGVDEPNGWCTSVLYHVNRATDDWIGGSVPYSIFRMWWCQTVNEWNVKWEWYASGAPSHAQHHSATVCNRVLSILRIEIHHCQRTVVCLSVAWLVDIGRVCRRICMCVCVCQCI